MRFNINDDVKVKLLPRGRRVHKSYWMKYIDIGKYNPPEVDDRGFTTFQLWDLMAIFGQHIFMGDNDPLFETTIEI